MSKLTNVWIYAENKDVLKELYTGARQMGESVSVLWAGDKSQAAGDHIYFLGELSSERLLEDYFPTISKLAQEKKPGLIMISATKKGRLLAGVLSADLGTSTLVDVSEISVKDGFVESVHMVYGGAAFRTEKASGTAVALVGTNVFAESELNIPNKIEDVEFISQATGLKCLMRQKRTVEKSNLGSAKTVVAVGRGFAAEEDLKMAEELAKLLNGDVGCSRPIAEGLGWMSRERYIGVSGKMLKPEVYIGVGISGQIHHMVGVNQSRVIIAINKDKNAPIFKEADYGLVGDLYQVLPQLIKKLAE
jgi:Electron transfer flavoprotein, alpha subunit